MTITLATLEDATAQDVFDQVAAHLIKQGEQSRRSGHPSVSLPGGCAYRGDGGLMCAAGCLISDEEYKEEMDLSECGDTSWDGLVDGFLVPSTRHNRLIQELQNAHDGVSTTQFKFQIIGRLAGVAIKHGLNFEEVVV